MRYLIRFLLIAMIAVSSFAFINSSPVEAGTDASFFTSVNFACPNIISFEGQWDSGDFDGVYVRAWDMDTGDLLAEESFPALILGINNFSGSFALVEPLPTTVIVELWQGFEEQIPQGSIGLSQLFNPPVANLDAGPATGPPLPAGDWWLEDQTTIIIPNCVTNPGCQIAFPIYGTALVLDQQLGYSEPNGEPARDVLGNLIWVLHDVDQDGQDTYLIVDIQTGADGETWLGIFIGSCDPVYVPLNMVYPLNAIPVD